PTFFSPSLFSFLLPAPPASHTLSLHDALPIFAPEEREAVTRVTSTPYRLGLMAVTLIPIPFAFTGRPIGIVIIYTVVGSFFIPRSEEHTSELQSRENLVCRLLLEKKKKKTKNR